MNYLPCSSSSFLKKRRQLSDEFSEGRPSHPFKDEESLPSFEDWQRLFEVRPTVFFGFANLNRSEMAAVVAVGGCTFFRR